MKVSYFSKKCKRFGGKHHHGRRNRHILREEVSRVELQKKWHHARSGDHHHKKNENFETKGYGHHKCHRMRYGHHEMGHGHHVFFKKIAKRHRMCDEMFTSRSNFQGESETAGDQNAGGKAPGFAPKSNKVRIIKEGGRFVIHLDTSCYQSNEITVEVMDGKIVVLASHVSVEDGAYECHEMHRSFDMPTDVSPESITSHLDSEGMLVIEAPLLPLYVVRNIPVIQLDE